jgi:hypothetical protein
MSYFTDKDNKQQSVYLRGLQAMGEDLQRQRQAILQKPFAGNAPALMAPVKCKALRPFYIGGKAVEVGTIVTLARHDAQSLAAIGKVEL